MMSSNDERGEGLHHRQRPKVELFCVDTIVNRATNWELSELPSINNQLYASKEHCIVSRACTLICLLLV